MDVLLFSLKSLLKISSIFEKLFAEMAIAKAKGEVLEKSFSPMWGSFIIPLLIILIAFLPKTKK